MLIAVCDDDIKLNIYLKNLLINKYGNYVQIYTFCSTSEMTDFILKKGLPDAIIMDICLGSENGINFLKELSQQIKNIPVIFVTGYTEYCQDIFIDFKPWGLLTKPIDEEKLFYHLNKVIELNKNNNLTVSLNVCGKELNIKAFDIIYMESRERKVIYHLNNNNISEYIKLDKVMQKLSDNFLRTHKSFVINLNYLKTFDKSSVTLTTGTTVPISRSNSENVKKVIFEYQSKQIGV